MDLEKIKQVHCIGIGGIGVSAIARLFLSMGKIVTGSDIRQSETVDELLSTGAKIRIGHAADNISGDADLVIHTEDVNETSPGFVELKKAQDLKIRSITYSKVLGDLMQGKKGIGVTGTNGKSTTTAMLGLIAEKAGIDPTVIVGSKVPVLPGSKFNANARVGQSEYFIVEADEYHRHMLDAKPWGVVVTNITADHLDYYRDLDDIKNAFTEYFANLPADGLLVYNAEDPVTLELLSAAKCRKASYGSSSRADLYATNVQVKDGEQRFELIYENNSLGEFKLKVPGSHNLFNAMGAVLMALKLGLPLEAIKESLAEFPGIWRRFEIIGSVNGKIIVSDYAHHPDGIEKTLEAAHQFYPEAKILTVFQPHQKNRTFNLYQEFVRTLQKCDGLIVTEIFSVVGREKVEINITSASLVKDLKGLIPDLAFAENLEEAGKLIREKCGNYDLILFMGAGDIDNLARKQAIALI